MVESNISKKLYGWFNLKMNKIFIKLYGWIKYL